MFQEIVNGLIRAGMTESGIAEKVGGSQPSINRIRKGKQMPGYLLGSALVELADEKCPGWRDKKQEAAA